MFCGQCGEKLKDGMKFCENCGAPVVHAEKENEKTTVATKKKENNKGLMVILAAVVLIAIVIAAIFVVKGNKEKKQYQELLDRGAAYLEELDYEQAEIAYLAAIEIDPKKPEPYVHLADLYIEQDEIDKAIDILEQADGVMDDEIIIEKLEVVKQYKTFRWYTKPFLEVESLDYVVDFSGIYNDMNRPFVNEYAVVESGEDLWLIDFDGEAYIPEKIERIKTFYGQYYVYCESGNSYAFEDGVFGTLYGHGAEVTSYVYCNGQIYYVDDFGGLFITEGDFNKYPMPVKQVSSISQITSTSEWADYAGKFALHVNDGLVTDFIYDAVGSFSDNIIAVCQDGKWGYVDTNGNTIIPCEFDASWKKYAPQSGFWTDDETVEMCYAFSEGYVPLCKDGVWELRDAAGNVVLAPGLFEEIRPVYNGLCWVKQNGLWGVIELVTEEEEVTAETDYSNIRVDFIKNYEGDETCGPDCQYGCESVYIMAVDENEGVLWTIETDHYQMTQLSRINEIGIYEDRYYYEEDGIIIAVSLTTGERLWENSVFLGTVSSFDFDENGTLYLCGYYGPDLCIIDKDGKGIACIEPFDEDYYWPYSLEYKGDVVEILFEGGPEETTGGGYLMTVDLDDYSYTVN